MARSTVKDGPVFGTLDDLHPLIKSRIMKLLADPELVATNFRPFETVRSPARHRDLLTRMPPVTKSKVWESAHNYGLAVDFVHFDNYSWSWHSSSESNWARFHALLDKHGLAAPITWDPGHVTLKEGWKQPLCEFLI